MALVSLLVNVAQSIAVVVRMIIDIVLAVFTLGIVFVALVVLFFFMRAAS